MTIEAQEILNDFINRWRINDVEKLTLQEYVGLNNKDTFCQWVETKTIKLGSIKGLTSIKFGIYERQDSAKNPKNYKNDDKYSWMQGYGDNKNEAFENIKKDIIKIIKLAEIGKFSEIDNILLPNLFKWKVAYLYSNERLIPIFKNEVLLKIAKSFGLKANSKTKISEIQKLMISQKPSELDVNEYTNALYEKFQGFDLRLIFLNEVTV